MKNQIVYVKAQAFNRATGDVVGTSRVEVVDRKSNKMFAFAETPLQIKQVYESFWNDLNPQSTDVVFVQQISFPAAEEKKFVMKSGEEVNVKGYGKGRCVGWVWQSTCFHVRIQFKTKVIDFLPSKLKPLLKQTAEERFNEAKELLPISDRTNPNKEQMLNAERRLQQLGVVGLDGSLITSTKNQKIIKWFNKNIL